MESNLNLDESWHLYFAISKYWSLQSIYFCCFFIVVSLMIGIIITESLEYSDKSPLFLFAAIHNI